MGAIERAFAWLIEACRLDPGMTVAPSFALRRFHYFKAKSPPEPMLLNSFYLGDLARAASVIGGVDAPLGLRQYLGVETPADTVDLLTDRAALEAAVAPSSIPPARWPSPGGHPLVMLQQAAVNLARTSLEQDGGLAAVNGPPGTGKTTLLRDVVASAVFDRADAMSAFDNPSEAFSTTGQRSAAGDKAFFHLYALHPSLKGHEVLVASSNNRAVENVSKELPSVRAVGRPAEMSYFRSISDLVHMPPTPDGEASLRPQGKTAATVSETSGETWGLIAAVLGNSANRAAFQRSFWWHEDLGFRLYLKAAKGDSVVRELKDEATGAVIRRETPAIIDREKPPTTPEAALRNWRSARARFRSLRDDVRSQLQSLETARTAFLEYDHAIRETARLKEAIARQDTLRPELIECISSAEAAKEAAAERHRFRSKEVVLHKRLRPGFFSRVVGTDAWLAWSSRQDEIVDAEMNAKAKDASAVAEVENARSALATHDQARKDMLAGLERQAEIALARRELIDRERKRLGARIVDDALFARGHEAVNLTPPWIPDGLQAKREDLFIASMALHRAFVDVCAQKILHNLSVLMDAFSSGLREEAKRRLLGDLWSTLFLVVPVLSTTFASVGRMMGSLPPHAIGWLLVDEAGQATPQAAVGAIMRARKTIVVGDPLQIEPVVTLPHRLGRRICEHFEVDPDAWTAPSASVQTLADQASQFQAAFPSDQGERRVGMPLLVHRRCQDPMFSISNRIAYAGQMVHAVSLGAGPISQALGPSSWIDVDGAADTKWCPAEGDVVVELLRRLARSGVTSPDLFVISPFRIVAQEMARRLEREHRLLAELEADPTRWPKDRVGTIHTFQGREAESVILVLGAPAAAQGGARRWAAGTPNVLNVAVSRAKASLYVVGSRGAWSGIGHAGELAAQLATTQL
jgi:hypothetical protein